MLVYLVAARAPRSRLLTAAVPLALWTIWYLWSRQFDQGITSASSLPGVPAFVVELAANSLAAIVGVNRSVHNSAATAVAIVFIPAAIVGAGLLVNFVRRNGARPWILAFVATILVFWIGVALAANDDREPTTPRYLYFGAIMILLVAAEAARGERLTGRRLRVAVGVLGICLALNVVRMGFGAADLTRKATEVRAQFAALELAAPGIDPNVTSLRSEPLDTTGILPRPALLIGFIREYGELGMPLSQLAGQSEALREGADVVLVRSQNLVALPLGPLGADETEGCQEFGNGGGVAGFELSPGVSVIRPVGSAAEELLLGRFADLPTVSAGELAPRQHSGVYVPDDRSSRPWIASASAPVEVCALAEGDGGGASVPPS